MKKIAKVDSASPAAKAMAAFEEGEFDEAVRLALPLANAGDPAASYLLGFAHETGKGVEQSREKAISYYRQGAAKGHPDSVYRLSFLLMASEAKDDIREARDMLEKQATQDPATAGRILGEAFLRGVFTAKPDADAALSWWRKAAEAGDVPSMVFLARFYEGQLGFPEFNDLPLALKYYTDAAGKGDTTSMVNLGSRLLSGDTRLRDEKKGREWISKAIDAKDADGHLALGIYQEDGKKDPKAALAEYEKGAEAGQVDCMLRAAVMHVKGLGTEADLAKGTGLLKKAAGAGSAQAYIELAAMALGGEKPDFGTAYAYLLTAANSGLPLAQNELGLFYLSGKLGVADLAAAVSWFGRAAQAGFAAAQSNLAALHEQGAGVSQSYENALQLYTLAANQGHPGATLALARFQAAGAGTKENKELAWALAQIAAERGEPNAAAFITELEKTLTKVQLAAAKKELATLKPEARKK